MQREQVLVFRNYLVFSLCLFSIRVIATPLDSGCEPRASSTNPSAAGHMAFEDTSSSKPSVASSAQALSDEAQSLLRARSKNRRIPKKLLVAANRILLSEDEGLDLEVPRFAALDFLNQVVTTRPDKIENVRTVALDGLLAMLANPLRPLSPQGWSLLAETLRGIYLDSQSPDAVKHRINELLLATVNQIDSDLPLQERVPLWTLLDLVLVIPQDSSLAGVYMRGLTASFHAEKDRNRRETIQHAVAQMIFAHPRRDDFLDQDGLDAIHYLAYEWPYPGHQDHVSAAQQMVPRIQILLSRDPSLIFEIPSH